MAIARGEEFRNDASMVRTEGASGSPLMAWSRPVVGNQSAAAVPRGLSTIASGLADASLMVVLPMPGLTMRTSPVSAAVAMTNFWLEEMAMWEKSRPESMAPPIAPAEGIPYMERRRWPSGRYPSKGPPTWATAAPDRSVERMSVRISGGLLRWEFRR